MSGVCALVCLSMPLTLRLAVGRWLLAFVDSQGPRVAAGCRARAPRTALALWSETRSTRVSPIKVGARSHLSPTQALKALKVGGAKLFPVAREIKCGTKQPPIAVNPNVYPQNAMVRTPQNAPNAQNDGARPLRLTNLDSGTPGCR